MVKHHQNFAFGVLCMLLGAAFAFGARSYSIGTSVRMGAGFFPFYVSCFLCLLGAWITFSSVGREHLPEGDIGKFPFRPVIFILGSNLAFGTLLVGIPGTNLPSMGLLVSVFVTVIVAAMAGRDFVWREALFLASILTVACYVLFVLMLKLNLPVLPAFGA